MKVQCEYCNSWIDDTDEKCPNCGGVNKVYKRATDQTPKTIEELKQWYVNHHLPPEETTRFFIGRNYQQPRAFGIYQNEKVSSLFIRIRITGSVPSAIREPMKLMR